MLRLSETESRELDQIIFNFPSLLDRAIADYAKLKAGVSQGLFTPDQVNTAMDWFEKFPSQWKQLRPNITDPELRSRADIFADTLSPNWAKQLWKKVGFGLAPLLIIGLIVLGVGATAVTVASLIKYWKKQINISKLIDGVVQGRIPLEVLEQAIQNEKSNVFVDAGNAIGKAALLGLLIFLGPAVFKAVKGKA